MPHPQCSGSWLARVQLIIVLLITVGRAAALRQRIELYRTNALLDANPLRRLNNVMYYGVVQLGSPGQNTTVCFDTGSSMVWTPADTFAGVDMTAHMQNKFATNASASFQIIARNFSEKYMSGGIVGVLATDSLMVGDLVVNNASIGLVTQASVNLTGASCDGIFGLARPGLARSGRPVFYKMLSEKGLLDEPTFSIWLNGDPMGQPAGSIEFGGSDSSLYTGSLYPLPVVSTKYWMVPLMGVRVGGTAVPVTARGAILHSGSALSLLTSKDFLYLAASVPGITLGRESGALEIVGGCSNISSLSNITFALGTGNFSLTPEQYIVQIGPKGACALAFQPGALDDTIVLGTNFLRAFYSTFTYNSTSKSSYVSLAPAIRATPSSNGRRMQELGGYPGDPSTGPGNPNTAAAAALQPPALSMPAGPIPVLGGAAPITPGNPYAAVAAAADALGKSPAPAAAAPPAGQPAQRAVASPTAAPGPAPASNAPTVDKPATPAVLPSAAPPALQPAALGFTGPPPAAPPVLGRSGRPALPPAASKQAVAKARAAAAVAAAVVAAPVNAPKAAAVPAAAAGGAPAPTLALAAPPRPSTPRPQPSAAGVAKGPAVAPSASAPSRSALPQPPAAAARSVAAAGAAAPKPPPKAATAAAAAVAPAPLKSGPKAAAPAPAKASAAKAAAPAATASAPAPNMSGPKAAALAGAGAPAAAPAKAVAAYSLASAPASAAVTGKRAATAAPTPLAGALAAPGPRPLPPPPARAPSPGEAKVPKLAPVPAPAALKNKPGAAPAPAPKRAPAAAGAVTGAPAPAPTEGAGAPVRPLAPSAAARAVQGAPGPALAPAPQPSAELVYATGLPFNAPAPAPSMSAGDLTPPFQAVAGIEALYGGLTSLWQLPLQITDNNDTLFAMYLASRPLTAKQNASLAKPRPPTMPRFSQPVSLVALDADMDTCVVGWSSIDSCRAKGLNETICSLMPVFSDVTTLWWQCPFKNETKAELPPGSGNFVPISQQWLLVRAGQNTNVTRGGQQIYNTGLGKCLDVCTDASPNSQCGHPGNIYLQDCDATSPTQQWLLSPTAMANATLATVDRSNLTAYQISSFFVDQAANVTMAQNGTETAVTRTCMDTCDAERWADALSTTYQETTCNLLLPTYTSSAAAFPCRSAVLPRSILQGFAIVTTQTPAAS